MNENYEKWLTAAIAEVGARNAEFGMAIHGKKYLPVAQRVEVFRKHFTTYGRLRLSHAEITPESVSMTAVVELWLPLPETTYFTWVAVAEGRAEEIRGSSQITRTSAVEVCETSAIGRALANFGLHGGEYASANEVEQAIKAQNAPPPEIPEDVKLTLEEAAKESADAARQAYRDLSETTRLLLSTHHRKWLKSLTNGSKS